MGAILAGGQASRFGSDKAHAFYEGERLIDRVGRALAAQCKALVICGREEAGFQCLPDRPEAGLGPLGGLNAALHHAAERGFTHVLSCGVDVPNLPSDIASSLDGEGPAIVQSQPVVGLWPVETAQALERFLEGGERALYAFADRVNARQVRFAPKLINVNSPEDLPPRA